MTGALDYLGATAQQLILKFGKAAVIRRPSRAYSATAGTYIDNSPAVTAYAVTVSPPDPFASRFINGETVLEGDAKCSVAAQGLAIVPTAASDKLVLDGSVWNIVDVARLYSGERVAAYELHIRQ